MILINGQNLFYELSSILYWNSLICLQQVMATERLDITQPLWDQSTFVGRFKHFAFISNPLLSLASETELHAAKDLYQKYK